MRELKFRAFNEAGMGQPFTLQEISTYDPAVNGKTSWPVSTIFMQYTGLKDKNGVEIYEGDIIEWKYEYDADYDGDMPIVKTSAGRHAIKDIFDRTHIVTSANESKGCWVIGNVHQNPELLKP